MRITNIRRGRIFRILGACILIVIFIFALSQYSSEAPRPSTGVLVGEYSVGGLVAHPGVYPTMGSKLGNFEPKVVRSAKGPGEGGAPYNMPPDKDNVVSASESEYGMNVAASDIIALNRSVPDTRTEECRYWNYPERLPTTSVIIAFHNEGVSVVKRNVQSIIDRSPPHILKEVLLVDDFSSYDDLKEEFDAYIERHWKGIVRILRNERRLGLIGTRSRGAVEATGEVIVFLDAHCEVNVNWLPPLLAPIYRDPTILTVPIIDGIDHKTFEYRPVYGRRTNFRGIFEWGMLYKETIVPEREARLHKHESEPYKSPTHAGGLFAISRQYFIDLGMYDSGLLVWGGENFELSFKIWQCGGSVEWVPCSRVGHVYRSFMPYSFGDLANKRKGSLITTNYKRVIETWFDEEHKKYFYTREPLAQFIDMGDISEQLALKKKLKCKDFGWYMREVAYDVYDKFPRLPENVHWGAIKSIGGGVCLDTMGRVAPAFIGIGSCHGLGAQLFRLNAAGQLGHGERCLEAERDNLMLSYCQLGTVNGPWSYEEESKHLVHRLQSHCLTLQPDSDALGLSPCDPHNTYQKWMLMRVKPDYQ